MKKKKDIKNDFDFFDDAPVKSSKFKYLDRANQWVINNLSSVPFVDKLMFVHHLQIMTKAGLSIVQSLNVLSKEIENPKLKTVITKITKEVESGNPFNEVLARFPKIFPSIYVSMIAAGEISGKLEESLEQVSNQMKKSQALMTKIRGAMIYPAVIMFAMVGISIFVVLYILPKILVMFKETQAELPLATKLLMSFTTFSQSYWWLMLIIIIGFISAFIFLMKKISFKRVVHRLIIKLPIAGIIVQKINLARFTLTLSSLLSSAIPIVEAVSISAKVLSNIVFRENLLDSSEGLKRGENLSSSLRKYPQTFPPMVVEMVMVGEQSGSVENMLKELAEYYNTEVENTMNNFTAIIEPVIILLLGLGVAGIAVAVIMPMYSLAQNV